MTAAPLPRPVSTADLPVYPIDAEARLDGNSFVKWHTGRWLASRTFKLASWEIQGMARALFDLCQMETPVGTLPEDDRELAFMLRCDSARLRELRAMEFGPFRNWTRCLCGDRVRLMHPVVTEQVQDALERRELAQLSKEEKAIQMRLDRLRKGLEKQGLGRDALADEVLIARMDEWLSATHRGRRSEAVYRSAILHAQQQRWLGGIGRSG